MKKVLIISIILLCLTGCKKTPEEQINAPEEKYIGYNEMKCIKEVGYTESRFWLFQDPKTNEVLRATLTIYEDIEPTGEDGKRRTINVKEMYCSDYDKSVFNDCEAVLDRTDPNEDMNLAIAKYTYINDKFNSGKYDTEDKLNIIKNEIESIGYKCNLITK